MRVSSHSHESWRVLALFLQVRPPHVCTGGNNRVRFWPRSNVAQRGIPHLCPPPKGTLLATFERGAERRSARLTWALLRMTTKPVQSASTGVSARPLDVGAASRGRPDRGRLAWAGDRSLRTTLPVPSVWEVSRGEATRKHTASSPD